MRFTLKGPATRYSGWGKVFYGVAKRLLPNHSVELLALDNDVPADYPLPITAVPRNNGLGVLLGDPTQINQLPTRYRVLYSMYEASDLPQEWIGRLRDSDEVWVPSTFCREVYGQYGRTRVVPFGYDEETYFRAEWTEGQRRAFWSVMCPQAIGKKVFGTAGVMSPRKGLDALLRAWEAAALPNAILVVKSRQRAVRMAVPGGVEVVEDDWSDALMASFYRSLDVFVFPTRGEGLGLPPLEAAACGTPALVTRASGPADYIDDRGVFGIEVAGQRMAGEWMRARDAMLYEPQHADLVDKLRAFCEDTPEVQHRYRSWSMAEKVLAWEAELQQAKGRALCASNS